MKIQAGSPQPAQIELEDGTVLFGGTYAECARVVEQIHAEVRTVILRDKARDELAFKNLAEDIPYGVYWHEEYEKFFKDTGVRMGQDFQELWYSRHSEFPEWSTHPNVRGSHWSPVPSSDTPHNTAYWLGKDRKSTRVASGGPNMQTLAKVSPVDGPSNSCDARPFPKKEDK